MNKAAALTPYLIPANSTKVVNIGDGLILRAIERLIGPFPTDRIFTTRAAPDASEFARMQSAGTLVVGGANQLTDTYSVWPGLTAAALDASGLRVVPFGVGLHGDPGKNKGLSQETRDLLETMHRRIPFSSWRCPRTVAILTRELPHLADQFLMTGCPVIFDRPLLEMDRFSDRDAVIAMTATDRDDFWERESTLLEHIAERFPKARRTLVLHQNFNPETRLEHMIGSLPGLRRTLKPQAKLRRFARRLGFQVTSPSTADEAVALYRSMDLHIGTRLHAHLHFLSQNKRSFLVAVDERSLGFSEAFDFPLSEPGRIETQFDFERVRSSARRIFATMSTFVRSLTALD